MADYDSSPGGSWRGDVPRRRTAGHLVVYAALVSAQPTVAIIAGPNGAGKSTSAPTLLRDVLGLTEYVNADVVALGLSGFDPGAAGLAAGRIVLDRLRTLATERRSFAFETTLASRSFAPWLGDLSTIGYHVAVVFLWLPMVDVAIARVGARVALGGHDVPEGTIRRRYARGLSNFFALYAPLATDWRFYDGSGPSLRLIAAGGVTMPERVDDPAVWSRLRSEHGDAS
jgi:predicted ABC-type ATPase